MQALRLLYAFVILCVGLVFAFIYFRATLFCYCFWSIMFSGLAFLFLLMGTGKQVVYQQLLRDKYKGREMEPSKAIQWQFGVFFYSMALPFSITANVLFWFKYDWVRADGQNGWRDKIKDWIPQHNNDYRKDIDDGLKVFYYRLENDNDWRSDFMVYAHLVPLICLTMDMMFNRIRMRGYHIFYQIGFTGLYLLATLSSQYVTDYSIGVYHDNLNWFCKNYYYQYDRYASTDGKDNFPASLVIDNDLKNGTCLDFPPQPESQRD